MAVYRVEKTHDYTVMANHHLRDERLSLKAKGLLSMLLSLPDDWEISIRGLASIVTDGVGAVQTGINELIEAGYIVRRRQHADTGAFAGFEYIIHEVPPCTENPYTANPYTGKPYTENPTLRNTEELSTDIPPIVPHEGDGKGEKPKRRKRATTAIPEWEPEMFERFWAAYPRGEDRQGAVREWDRLKPDRRLMFEMSAALDRQKKSEEWLRGIGIPYACRWLSKKRWTDRVDDASLRPAPGGWAESREVL